MRANRAEGLTHLYRYGTLWRGEESCCRNREIFTDTLIFLSSPFQFNDPFDCQVAPLAKVSDNDLRHYLRRGWQKRGADRWEMAKHIGEKVASGYHRTQAFEEDCRANNLKRFGGLGVHCLTARPDSLLMWSHYASKHSGYCLRFRNAGTVGEAHRVRYRCEYPTLDHFGPSHQDLVEALLTKAKIWEYEDEYRLVSTDGCGLMQLEPGLLDGVIFGCRTSESDEACIRELCSSRPEPVCFLRATQSKNEFRIEIEPA